MSKPIIEVKDYSYRYASTEELVLKNITFTVNEGDFVGVVGCNRAGKSTLCKSIVGILPFVSGGDWSGEIVIDGKSLNDTKGNGTTDVVGMTDLVVTMCKAGISYNFVFTFVDSFQVITLLRKDMEQIRDAQRARGLNTEGNLLQRFKAFIPIIVPVVANSIIKVQDQAVAMDTKGFNSSCKKTVYRELTPYKWDAACKWLGIFLGVFAVLYRILAAVQVIPAFLTNII